MYIVVLLLHSIHLYSFSLWLHRSCSSHVRKMVAWPQPRKTKESKQVFQELTNNACIFVFRVIQHHAFPKIMDVWPTALKLGRYHTSEPMPKRVASRAYSWTEHLIIPRRYDREVACRKHFGLMEAHMGKV
jgi:hypothetical protein